MKAQRAFRQSSTTQQQADAAAGEARRSLIASTTPKAARAAMLKAFGVAVDAAIRASRHSEAMQRADTLGFSGKVPRPTILDATQRALLRGEAYLAKQRAEDAFDACVTVTIGNETPPAALETPSAVAELLLACQPFRNLLATFRKPLRETDVLLERVGPLGSTHAVHFGDLRQLHRAAGAVTRTEPA